MLEKVKDKNVMSFPYKDKKTKKLIRKEIKIARIDVSNKNLIEKLSSIQI